MEELCLLACSPWLAQPAFLRSPEVALPIVGTELLVGKLREASPSVEIPSSKTILSYVEVMAPDSQGGNLPGGRKAEEGAQGHRHVQSQQVNIACVLDDGSLKSQFYSQENILGHRTNFNK